MNRRPPWFFYFGGGGDAGNDKNVDVAGILWRLLPMDE